MWEAVSVAACCMLVMLLLQELVLSWFVVLEVFGSGLPKSFDCFRCNSSLWEKYWVQYCTVSLLITY